VKHHTEVSGMKRKPVQKVFSARKGDEDVNQS